MPSQKQIQWNQVKAHFVLKGDSVASWCRKNDIDPGNMRKIFDGEWTGPRATELLRKLNKETSTSEKAA